jgi:hypothetical protein
MKPNQDVLSALEEMPGRQQSELQHLVDEYKTACELAQGPNLDRSKHWKTRAWDLECHLKERLRKD